MRSLILVPLLLLKQVLAANELHEETIFDGYKDIRDGIKGSMTREYHEAEAPTKKRLLHPSTIYKERPSAIGQVFTASELHEESLFDGYKDIRDGIKGSMTSEFRETEAATRERLHQRKPFSERPKSMGLDFLINNETVDKLFAILRHRFAAKGPVAIPLPADQDFFTVELFNNTMDGSVSVYGGEIQGLDTIHRTGDTELDINVLRGGVTFTTTIGLNDLSASYYGSLLLKGLGTDAGLDLSVTHIELHVKVFAKIKLAKMELEKLEIKELSFPQVGTFESHIKLTGILDPVIDMLLDTVLNLVVGEPIFESLSDVLKQLINDKLADMDVASLSPYLRRP